MSDPIDPQVSHVDLYHKLGKLEGLMETMMNSVSSFQLAIKDVHSRIDQLEKRQVSLESKKSSESGAVNALTSLGRDFAVPLLAIAVAWLVASKEAKQTETRQDHIPIHQQNIHKVN